MHALAEAARNTKTATANNPVHILQKKPVQLHGLFLFLFVTSNSFKTYWQKSLHLATAFTHLRSCAAKTLFGNDTCECFIDVKLTDENTSLPKYHSVAIGCHSVSVGYHSAAVGCHSVAVGCHSAAIGCHSATVRYHSAAIGCHSAAVGYHSVAVECHSAAMVCHPVAVGYHSVTVECHSAAVVYHSATVGCQVLSIRCQVLLMRCQILLVRCQVYGMTDEVFSIWVQIRGGLFACIRRSSVEAGILASNFLFVVIPSAGVGADLRVCPLIRSSVQHMRYRTKFGIHWRLVFLGFLPVTVCNAGCRNDRYQQYCIEN